MKIHKYLDQSIEGNIEVAIVYGTALMLWKEDFLFLIGFDTKFFMYYEDIDFCDRFRNIMHGTICYSPQATIIHNVQGSSNGNGKIKWSYLKSKYLYGIHKFKLGMVFFIIFDILLLAAFRFYKLLKIKFR